MDFKTLQDMDLTGKTVLLRADLNVPVKDKTVTDTTRIDRLKPTIDYLKGQNCKTLILSHFGRPKGERKDEFSLNFLPDVLQKQWGTPIFFVSDCIGEAAHNHANEMKDGDFALLENVRFHAGEESNDAAFVTQLAALADIFVNDAFSTSHRAHASTEGLSHHLPSCAGFLMAAEIKALSDALEAPERPVMAFVGGAKISTKLSVLMNMTEKVDYLFLGGGMANTFLFAKGHSVGKSLCENDMADEARKIMEKADSNQCRIVLPKDLVVVEKLKENAEFEIVDIANVSEDKMAVDNGPQTIEEVNNILEDCKTVLWNGPLGVFEIPPFDKATNDVARFVAEKTKQGSLKSIAGGGDTVSALENANVVSDFSYISTAGGAFLEWLEGKSLPGVAALMGNREAA